MSNNIHYVTKVIICENLSSYVLRSTSKYKIISCIFIKYAKYI